MSIIVYGAKTFSEINSIMDQASMERWTDLNTLLNQLIREGDIFLNEKGEYTARIDLVEDYQYYEEHMDEWLEPPMEWEYEEHIQQQYQNYPNIVSATKSWVKLQEPEIILKQDHFFLESHFLDSFTRFLLTKAYNSIIIVNPFLDRSTPTQLLIKAKRKGKTVVVVTRPSSRNHIKKLHEWLIEHDLMVLFHKNLHAKIIIVDNLLAIVSSMNFMQRATAGITWEAGLVTLDNDIVDSIKSSIADLDLKPE